MDLAVDLEDFLESLLLSFCKMQFGRGIASFGWSDMAFLLLLELTKQFLLPLHALPKLFLHEHHVRFQFVDVE